MLLGKTSLSALFACGCAMAQTADLAFDDAIRLDRYTVQKQSPRPEQLDLLSTRVETQFPDSVSTVGDAIDYILQRSGYRRIKVKSTAQQMDLPLPEVHRNLGPLTLRTGIRTLAGPTLELLEDTASRTVWFAGAAVTGSSVPQPATVTSQQSEEAVVHTLADSISAEPMSVIDDWELSTDMTLRENLESWATRAGWDMTWKSRHDYQIDHSAVFRSTTFEDAVAETLGFYRTAPVPLTATYYEGNSVVVIAPTLSTVIP